MVVGHLPLHTHFIQRHERRQPFCFSVRHTPIHRHRHRQTFCHSTAHFQTYILSKISAGFPLPSCVINFGFYQKCQRALAPRFCRQASSDSVSFQGFLSISQFYCCSSYFVKNCPNLYKSSQCQTNTPQSYSHLLLVQKPHSVSRLSTLMFEYIFT